MRPRVISAHGNPQPLIQEGLADHYRLNLTPDEQAQERRDQAEQDCIRRDMQACLDEIMFGDDIGREVLDIGEDIGVDIDFDPFEDQGIDPSDTEGYDPQYDDRIHDDYMDEDY